MANRTSAAPKTPRTRAAVSSSCPPPFTADFAARKSTRQASPGDEQGWQNAAASEAGVLALAPMDGVTDATFRELITDLYTKTPYGHCGIDLCVTEFVRVCAQKVPDSVFLRHFPELRQNSYTREQTPVFVQLLGGDVEAMTRAAQRAYALGAMGIDLNFGCPAKTVNRHDGGATLLKAPRRIASVCGAIKNALPTNFPVTAKIRLGWEDATGVDDLARAAQDGGATWLTIHARTRVQLYRPPVDWRSIDRARRAVTMPVIANGDVFDLASYRACRQQSGCSSVMIGRGIMADPGLFLRLRGYDIPSWDLPAFAQLWREYGRRLIARNPERTHPLGRVKQWVRMAAQIRPEIREAFDHIKRIQDWPSAELCLRDWAQRPSCCDHSLVLSSVIAATSNLETAKAPPESSALSPLNPMTETPTQNPVPAATKASRSAATI